MSRRKVRRGQQIDLYPSASCHECPETWPVAVESRDAAKAHVAETGHVVIVDVVTRTAYEPEGAE